MLENCRRGSLGTLQGRIATGASMSPFVYMTPRSISQCNPCPGHILQCNQALATHARHPARPASPRRVPSSTGIILPNTLLTCFTPQCQLGSCKSPPLSLIPRLLAGAAPIAKPPIPALHGPMPPRALFAEGLNCPEST